MQVQTKEPTIDQVNQAVNAILEILGAPENDLHADALTAWKQGNYQYVKRLAATNLSDFYCKALGYLGGALKLTPNTDTILAESARAASDFVREKTLHHLSKKISEALD
ncbi:MAG: hypothetical protein KME49_22775 [Brasilonema octagenarum HA4186-MV1]|jgi:hypothetical protein|nr:hypothetical protein [Brasilonema octagenarum HA4186-MV1]